MKNIHPLIRLLLPTKIEMLYGSKCNGPHLGHDHPKNK